MRFEEALAQARQAEELDPLSPGGQAEAGIILYLSRRYDEATSQFRRLPDRNPSFTYAHFCLALVHLQKRDDDSALFDPLRANPRFVALAAKVR